MIKTRKLMQHPPSVIGQLNGKRAAAPRLTCHQTTQTNTQGASKA